MPMTALVVLTPGYQLSQVANDTAVMMDVHPDQRRVVSGLISLSRNLGLITGASVLEWPPPEPLSPACGLRSRSPR